MEPTIACGRCGGSSPADASFCIECGASLATAATGPTVRLERPRQQLSPRPAAPPPFVPLRPLPPIAPPPFVTAPHPPTRPAPARAANLAAPFAVIAAALALLLVPRFGATAVLAIGAGGLLLRGLLTRPDRVLPLALLLGFVALMASGSHLIWPALLGFFVLRAVLRGQGWRP